MSSSEGKALVPTTPCRAPGKFIPPEITGALSGAATAGALGKPAAAFAAALSAAYRSAGIVGRGVSDSTAGMAPEGARAALAAIVSDARSTPGAALIVAAACIEGPKFAMGDALCAFAGRWLIIAATSAAALTIINEITHFERIIDPPPIWSPTNVRF
ncbi:MAG TPA: hypothetical protein VKT27_09550 [Candidatus Binataceae bacterium]|nr:hypothetical protein [Candidatus Binataceae bacterium]